MYTLHANFFNFGEKAVCSNDILLYFMAKWQQKLLTDHKDAMCKMQV